MSGAGLRKERRSEGYVRVWNDVAADEELSYRALGLLTYLLSRPDGWDVRSQLLSKPEGREGREAVRTALHELGRRGYYRLERRRLRSGTCVMGTAVADHPVAEWARDYAACDGPAVAVIEQADGTFATVGAETEAVEGTGDGFPGAGSLRAPGNRTPVYRAPGFWAPFPRRSPTKVTHPPPPPTPHPQPATTHRPEAEGARITTRRRRSWTASARTGPSPARSAPDSPNASHPCWHQAGPSPAWPVS